MITQYWGILVYKRDTVWERRSSLSSLWSSSSSSSLAMITTTNTPIAIIKAGPYLYSDFIRYEWNVLFYFVITSALVSRRKLERSVRIPSIWICLSLFPAVQWSIGKEQNGRVGHHALFSLPGLYITRNWSSWRMMACASFPHILFVHKGAWFRWILISFSANGVPLLSGLRHVRHRRACWVRLANEIIITQWRNQLLFFLYFGSIITVAVWVRGNRNLLNLDE